MPPKMTSIGVPGPPTLPLPGISAIVSGVALIYGTLLGTVGASFGGRMGRAR